MLSSLKISDGISRIKRNFLMLSLLGVIGLAGWNIFSVIKDRAAREFCIPHKVAASGFWLRQKGNIDFYRTDSLAFLPLLADLKSNVRIDRESYYPLQNSYTLGNRKLLIIDESGVYPCTSAPVDLLWIRESPKIHLDRILTDLNPKQVIVDGSNYKNDITLWEKTCKSKGIPLHVTASDGAFLLNF